MTRLAIIGSGDLGQQILHHALAAGSFEVVGFFDDFRPPGERVKGVPIIGRLSELLPSFERGEYDALLIGIGYRHMAKRESLHAEYGGKIPLATVVHPAAFVDPSAELGAGCVVYPGAIVDAGVKLGENVVVNVGATVAHDSRVGAHSFLSPRVAVAGFVTIGERAILGINSTIIDGLKIGSDIQLGGGAVAIENLERPGLYVGVPAKWKKQRRA